MKAEYKLIVKGDKKDLEVAHIHWRALVVYLSNLNLISSAYQIGKWTDRQYYDKKVGDNIIPINGLKEKEREKEREKGDEKKAKKENEGKKESDLHKR